jgi:hypothetical protein
MSLSVANQRLPSLGAQLADGDDKAARRHRRSRNTRSRPTRTLTLAKPPQSTSIGSVVGPMRRSTSARSIVACVAARDHETSGLRRGSIRKQPCEQPDA